jgi:hypothetical protein
MNRRRGQLLLVTALIAVCAANAADTAGHLPSTRDELLAFLAKAIKQARSTPPGFEEAKPGPTPELKPLIGVSGDRLRFALGDPDLCSVSKEGHCASAGQWAYILDPVVPGMRGGGSRELSLQFDSAGSCKSAKWRGGR